MKASRASSAVHLQRRRVAGSACGDQHVVDRLREIVEEQLQGVVVAGVEGRRARGSHFARSMLQPLGIAAGQQDLGSLERLEIAVHDIEAARDDLIGRGVNVGEIYHLGEGGPAPGPDPNRTSYNSYAEFSDPDGNGWVLQEITERLPGR